MIYVSRKEHFNAAHKMHNPNWSLEKNQEVFGACANENWHGHNYEVIITVKGEINLETGYLVDLKRLGKLFNEKIHDKVDHKNLNIDVDFLQGKMTSSENFAIAIWNELKNEVPKISNEFAQLYKITLYETPRNFVEYYGE